MDIIKTLEIFDKYACKYLRREGNIIQGSLDAKYWFNIAGFVTDTTANYKPKEELDFVDEDIKEYFKQSPAKEGFSTISNGYCKGTPTMMQLVKELRTFNKNFKENVGDNGS